MSYNAYLWFKFIHYAAFISWMAVLFYQPRLFVYHIENKDNADFVRVVKKMECMLFNSIGWVAFVFTIFSATMMFLFKTDLIKVGYFHIKLTCALILIIYHFTLFYYLKQLQNDRCKRGGRFFRILNEIPTIIMLIIIYAMINMQYGG